MQINTSLPTTHKISIYVYRAQLNIMITEKTAEPGKILLNAPLSMWEYGKELSVSGDVIELHLPCIEYIQLIQTDDITNIRVNDKESEERLRDQGIWIHSPATMGPTLQILPSLTRMQPMPPSS